MIQRTYGQVKDQLAQIAGNTGLPVDDGLVLQYTNNAIQELMNKGDWPGVVDRWYFKFDEITGEVALPYWLDRLMSVTVDDCPKTIASPWYEFVAYGPGTLHDEELDRQGNTLHGRYGWNSMVVERGDSPLQVPITFYGNGDAGGPAVRLAVIAPDDEFTGTTGGLLVQGLDQNGNIVRTETFPDSGIWITGDFLPLVQETPGTAYFSKITSVTKPVTIGPVYLQALTFAPGNSYLATYQFNETQPSYRHYFIPSLFRPDDGIRDRIIRARCRRRFVPITEDSDLMIIGNVLALQETMIAQYKRQVGAFPEYAAHIQSAIDIMAMEANAYTGKSRVPTISFQRGFNVGTLPMLR